MASESDPEIVHHIRCCSCKLLCLPRDYREYPNTTELMKVCNECLDKRAAKRDERALPEEERERLAEEERERHTERVVRRGSERRERAEAERERLVNETIARDRELLLSFELTEEELHEAHLYLSGNNVAYANGPKASDPKET